MVATSLKWENSKQDNKENVGWKGNSIKALGGVQCQWVKGTYP